MLILMNSGKQFSMRLMEAYIKKSRLQADIITATSREMMSKILKAFVVDAVFCCLDSPWREDYTALFGEAREYNKSVYRVLMTDGNAESLAGTYAPYTDDIIKLPVVPGEFSEKLSALRKGQAVEDSILPEPGADAAAQPDAPDTPEIPAAGGAGSADRPAAPAKNKTGRTVRLLLSAVLLSIVVLTAQLWFQTPGPLGAARFAGYLLFGSANGSAGTVPARGSLVFVKPVEPAFVQTGDVIAVRDSAGSGVRFQKVVAVNGGAEVVVKARGVDGKTNNDETVRGREVVGTVKGSVPGAGFLLGLTRGAGKGAAYYILIPGALLLLYESIVLCGKPKEKDEPFIDIR